MIVYTEFALSHADAYASITLGLLLLVLSLSEALAASLSARWLRRGLLGLLLALITVGSLLRRFRGLRCHRWQRRSWDIRLSEDPPARGLMRRMARVGDVHEHVLVASHRNSTSSLCSETRTDNGVHSTVHKGLRRLGLRWDNTGMKVAMQPRLSLSAYTHGLHERSTGRSGHTWHGRVEHVLVVGHHRTYWMARQLPSLRRLGREEWLARTLA